MAESDFVIPDAGGVTARQRAVHDGDEGNRVREFTQEAEYIESARRVSRFGPQLF